MRIVAAILLFSNLAWSAGLLVPPWKNANSTDLQPRSTAITHVYGNNQGFSLSCGGTSAATAQFDVTAATSTTIGEIIKPAASGSVDNLELQDSSGNVESAFQSDNTLLLKNRNYTWTSGAVSAPALKHAPTITQNTEAIWVPYVFHIAPIFNYGIAQTLSQVNGELLSPSLVSSNSLGSGTDTISLNGLITNPSMNLSVGPRTATAIQGISINPSVAGTAGTVTTVTSVAAALSTGTSGTTITTRNGVSVSGAATVGTNTTTNQLLLSSLSTGASNLFAIRQQGTNGTNVLNAKTKVGADSVAGVDMDVNGWINFAGETRVSSQFDKTDTNLANITGLSVTLVAGRTYRFRAFLHVTPDATGGHKYAIAGTATASNIIYEIVATRNSNSLNVITSRQTALAGSAGAAGGTSNYTIIDGMITVGNAGTLTVQFAQNAASGTSSVLVGSTFTVWDVL